MPTTDGEEPTSAKHRPDRLPTHPWDALTSQEREERAERWDQVHAGRERSLAFRDLKEAVNLVTARREGEPIRNSPEGFLLWQKVLRCCQHEAPAWLVHIDGKKVVHVGEFFEWTFDTGFYDDWTPEACAANAAELHLGIPPEIPLPSTPEFHERRQLLLERLHQERSKDLLAKVQTSLGRALTKGRVSMVGRPRELLLKLPELRNEQTRLEALLKGIDSVDESNSIQRQIRSLRDEIAKLETGCAEDDTRQGETDSISTVGDNALTRSDALSQTQPHGLEVFRRMPDLRFEEVDIGVDPERLMLTAEARGKRTSASFRDLKLLAKNDVSLNRQGKKLLKLARAGFAASKGEESAIRRLSENLREAFDTQDPPFRNESPEFTLRVPKYESAKRRAMDRTDSYDTVSEVEPIKREPTISEQRFESSDPADRFLKSEDSDYDPKDPTYSQQLTD